MTMRQLPLEKWRTYLDEVSASMKGFQVDIEVSGFDMGDADKSNGGRPRYPGCYPGCLRSSRSLALSGVGSRGGEQADGPIRGGRRRGGAGRRWLRLNEATTAGRHAPKSSSGWTSGRAGANGGGRAGRPSNTSISRMTVG